MTQEELRAIRSDVAAWRIDRTWHRADIVASHIPNLLTSLDESTQRVAELREALKTAHDMVSGTCPGIEACAILKALTATEPES